MSMNKRVLSKIELKQKFINREEYFEEQSNKYSNNWFFSEQSDDREYDVDYLEPRKPSINMR